MRKYKVSNKLAIAIIIGVIILSAIAIYVANETVSVQKLKEGKKELLQVIVDDNLYLNYDPETKELRIYGYGSLNAENCGAIPTDGVETITYGNTYFTGSFSFQMFPNLKRVNNMGTCIWDISGTELFSGCENLIELDLSGFRCENDWSLMFRNCTSLKSINFGDEIRSATSMYRMFENCTSLEDIDLSNFHTRLSDIRYMFNNCRSLKSANLSGLELTNMNPGFTDNVFTGCNSLACIYTPRMLGVTSNNIEITLPNEFYKLSNGTAAVNKYTSIKGQMFGSSNTSEKIVIKYYIRYRESMSSATMTEYNKYFDEDIEIMDNMYNYINGYKFKCWIDESENEYYPGSIYSDNKKLELFPKWEPIQYIIRYNAYDCEGIMKDDIVNFNEPVNLKGNKFTKQGYKFIGWAATQADADSRNIWFNDQATLRYNLTDTDGEIINLYAVWEPNKDTPYKVEYYKQNTTLDGYDLAYTEEKLTGETEEYVIAKEKEYEGFYRIHCPEEIPEGEIAGDGSLVLKLYYDREWKQLEFKEGNYTFLNTMLPYGTSILEFPGAEMPEIGEYVGHIFKGWFYEEEIEEEGRIKIVELEFTNQTIVTRNLTLEKKWEPIQYTIKYNANSGQGTMEDDIVEFDQYINLKENTFIKPGYTFIGWAETQEDADNRGFRFYDQDGIFNLTTTDGEIINLYAVWEPIQYIVRYNANSGEGNMSDEVCIYDEYKVLTENAFVRTGYTFKGWALSQEDANKEKISFRDKGQIIKLAEIDGKIVNLYAVWEPIQYTIRYNFHFKGITRSIDTMADDAAIYDEDKVLKAFNMKDSSTTERLSFYWMGYVKTKSGPWSSRV